MPSRSKILLIQNSTLGETNSCIDSDIPDIKCNCDVKQPTWDVDEGRIFSKELLPVTGFQYGPLEFDLERANITIGRLECSGKLFNFF